MVPIKRGLSGAEKTAPWLLPGKERYFATLSPMQQERVLTQIHTLGFKEEMPCFLVAVPKK